MRPFDGLLRTDPVYPAEGSVEVCVVRKAAGLAGIPRAVPLGQHLPRMLQALQKDIVINTCPDALPKLMRKVVFADIEARSKTVQAQLLPAEAVRPVPDL